MIETAQELIARLQRDFKPTDTIVSFLWAAEDLEQFEDRYAFGQLINWLGRPGETFQAHEFEPQAAGEAEDDERRWTDFANWMTGDRFDYVIQRHGDLLNEVYRAFREQGQ